MTTFTVPWSDDIPQGSIRADDLDQAIRDLRRDIHERMNSLFGIEWSSDPLTVASLPFSQYIALGTNPAQSGEVRLPSAGSVKSRNAANLADVTLLSLVADILQFAGNKARVDPANGNTSVDGTFSALGISTFPRLNRGAGTAIISASGFYTSASLTGSSGTDMAGTIVLATGSGGVPASPTVSVTFSSTYTTVPVILIAGWEMTPTDPWGMINVTATGFDIAFTTVTASQNYHWSYLVIK